MVILFARLAFAAPTLEINAHRDRVYLGESFLLEIKVGGSSEPGEPDLSQIRGCRVESLGSQNISHQSIVIINGQIRREGFVGRTYAYKLTPTQEGTLETGPITVLVEGERLQGSGPPVTVTGVTQQDVVRISVSASREAVLVDEPFEIRLTIRLRGLPGVYADTDPLLPSASPNLNAPFLSTSMPDGLKGPDISSLLNPRLVRGNQPGFTLNDFTVQGDPAGFAALLNNGQPVPARFQLDRRPVVQNGVRYLEYYLALTYTGEAEGAYTFGPVVFKGQVPTNINARGQATGADIFAVGPAAIVRVIPPPEADRPESYIGAIGTNLLVTAFLDTQTCHVGDPLELTLSIDGSIQMRNLLPPKLSLQTNLLEHFEIYDDTVKTTKQNGHRQYVYTLRPRHAGAFELPAVAVSYYDANLRQYRTVNTVPIPLKVRQSVEVTASQVIGGSTNTMILARQKDETEMQPAGMRIDPGAIEPGALAGRPATVVAVAMPGPVIFAVTWLILYYQRHRAHFDRSRRRRRALGRATRLLRSASKDPEGVHVAVCRAMRLYLADRTDRSSQSATPDEIRQLLITGGISPELANRFAEVMQAHFNASFGPAPAPDIAQVRAVMAAVEQAWQKPRCQPSHALSSLGFLLAAGGLLTLSLPASASTRAEREFILNEADSRLTSARAPSEFLTAASIYQKLVDRGVCNATILFNEGTALLLAGKHADAVQVLLRVERYAGSAPDIRRNLAIALGHREGLKKPLTPWNRVVLFWHYGLSCRTRLLITAMAFSLLWLAGALRLAGFRNLATSLAIAAVCTVALFGSSVLTTLHQENQARTPAALLTPD
jgi:hypothetical protein